MTTPTITRLKLPAVRHAISARPWAIQPEAGEALLDYVQARASGTIGASEPRARSADRRPVTKSGGAIAVLPLYGVIAQRMDMMMAYCGGTSTERFADDFDAAIADPDVSAIVIDCDSPGGNVQGTPELAKRILAARSKGKKLTAVANGTMASAAYWICSACDEVVASPSAEVGSIGVFCVHLDESGLNEQLGLKYTIVKAGEHKAEGNPWEALSADAEAYLQSQVDEMYSMFVGAVAKHRGIDVKTVNADFGQGRTMTAKQALSAGMIDRVATLEDTLKRLGAKNVGLSGRPVSAAAAGLTLVAGDIAPDEPDDDDLCPTCGAALDDDDNCTACDYRGENDDTDASTTSARADGAAAVDPPHPDQRPAVAKEQPVANETTAAPGGAVDIDARIAAERQRASTIRKLGKTHRITDDQVDAMISEGLTIDQASTRILGQVEARGAAAPGIRVGADREAEKPFANVGEQLSAIMQLKRFGTSDARLGRVNYNAMQIDRAGALDMMAGSPSGMNESVGSEGGFFLAPEVLPGVIEPVYATDPFLSRVTRIPIGSSSNRTIYNVVDETSRVDGSRWGGIQMFYADEADTIAAKKYKLRQVEQLLKKIMGLAYLTDEQMTDAPASNALLTSAFTTELQFMLSNEGFRGLGGSHILGFLKGKGGVTQAIEAGQTIANTAASISANVAKMKANIPAALWGDIIWLYNQELYPYLINATLGATTVPAFVPAGGVGDQGSVDRILGAPAYASELCEQVGTTGDIIAIAPSQYHFAEKGGAQIATSVHVRFINDEFTLRITYRADGKPVWNTTVTPFKGTTARGFFSTLNTRV